MKLQTALDKSKHNEVIYHHGLKLYIRWIDGVATWGSGNPISEIPVGLEDGFEELKQDEGWTIHIPMTFCRIMAEWRTGERIRMLDWGNAYIDPSQFAKYEHSKILLTADQLFKKEWITFKYEF